MKQYFTLLMLLTASFAFAQKIKIKVEEQNETIGGGKHNALVVVIYDSNKDDVEKVDCWIFDGRNLVKQFRK